MSLKEFLVYTGCGMVYFSIILTIFNLVYFKIKPILGWKQVLVVDSIVISASSIPLLLNIVRFTPAS